MAACGSSEAAAPPAKVSQALSQSVLSHYATLAFLTYRDAALSARALSTELARFVAAPSAEALQAAQKAWLAARAPYLQSEVFRFYEGPIDQVEMYVNPWPIDETYVESLDGKPARGLIDDLAAYPELTKQTLLSMNEKEGETSISTGFHVIEFLLWGRDTSSTGPGDRSYLDYVQSGDGALLATRRGTYLKLAGELLAEQLEQVRDAWQSGRPDNYRAAFLATPSEQGLAKILKGMGMLSGAELAGERLTVPYETKDQENEHSCFSDNTQRDVVGDALGLQNVCTGRYVGLDGETTQGAGLCQLVAASDPALAAKLEAEIAETVRRAKLIPAPFDQALLGADSAPGRSAISATIDALRAQARTLDQVAIRLGASLPFVSMER